MRTAAVLDWLEPRVLTERFQATHLIVNYSLLTLAIALYLAGVVSAGVISLACLPGAACFILSVELLAWKQANSNENPLLLANLR